MTSISNAVALPALLTTESSASTAARLDWKEKITKGHEVMLERTLVSIAKILVTYQSAIVAAAVTSAANNCAAAMVLPGAPIQSQNWSILNPVGVPTIGTGFTMRSVACRRALGELGITRLVPGKKKTP